MIFSRCLGYDTSYISEPIKTIESYSLGKGFRYEHKHRSWEYGMAIRFLRDYDVARVLNVGGGNSPLSSFLADSGKFVAEIDPGSPDIVRKNVSYIIDSFPTSLFSTEKFDAVLCTSVIEHIPDDISFFLGLLKISSKLVFITTDFSESGEAFSRSHLRTYNVNSIENLITIANKNDFEVVGRYDYTYDGNHVYDYTFASLALRRV